MNKTRVIHFPLLLAVLALIVGLVWYTQPTEAESIPSDGLLNSGLTNSNLIYLPIITNITPFDPPGDTTLPGGTYTFSTFNVPDGATVTVTGDVHITVTGDTNIAGTLTGDCVEIQLHGQQDVTVTGTVDNKCSDPQLLTTGITTGDLTIYGYGETMTVGSLDTPAILRSSGNLNMGNAPDIEDWEYDVLPDERAIMPMPPVCSAEADILLERMYGGSSIIVDFFGNGADPNGGPVSYQWEFGDGTVSYERDPRHTYTGWGLYDVTLTVSDKDGQQCHSTLRLVFKDGDENEPASPAVSLEIVDLVVAAGEPVDFTAVAKQLGLEDADDDDDDDDLAYLWDFGDTLTNVLLTSEPAVTHTYSQSGRYEVTVTVTDADGNNAMATGSVYIFEQKELALNYINTPPNCLFPAPNATIIGADIDLGTAPVGQNGKNERLRYRGDVYVGVGTTIQGQHGGPGQDETGAGEVTGGKGGRGGNLSLLVRGRLTVCGGATLAAGDGGRGGHAVSDTPAPGHAIARGGAGGPAASLLRVRATQGINYQATFGAPVTRKPGNGGVGGTANATGGDGAIGCVGEIGARATAYGGKGGKASKERITRGRPVGIANTTVDGGLGGNGGSALAQAGAGGAANCPTSAQGGNGGRANAYGGKGGVATYRPHPDAGLAPGAFKGGDGGNAEARSGHGGSAEATPPGGVTAVGGEAGQAFSQGGRGATGRTNGNGGDALAIGGNGGMSTATGEDGDACQDGDTAEAIGGRGGRAVARQGWGPGAAANGQATANGGNGGEATARGGDGGDCDVCPAGDGGNGGLATATGGRGGNAVGRDTRVGGTGGKGDALGGQGGDGADCCGPPHLAGGNGGSGGEAISTAGAPGLPNGNWGTNATRGGDGGNGGDGEGPGAGGAGGPGSGTPNNIPDGDPGVAGEHCPVPPPPQQGTPNHGQIPDGPIPPGAEFDLDLIDPDDPDIIGIVPTRFMSEDELLPYDVPGALYEKLPDQIFVGMGGINYDLTLLPDDFTVLSAEFTLVIECPPGCIVIMGFYQGELVAVVQNQGPPGLETLLLPNPAEVGSTAPHYDTIIMLAFGPMSFDLLAIAFLNG